MEEYKFPIRETWEPYDDEHPMIPANLLGTWYATDRLLKDAEMLNAPANTVVHDEHEQDSQFWWICDGHGNWAGVAHDGRVLGFINLHRGTFREWVPVNRPMPDLVKLLGVEPKRVR